MSAFQDHATLHVTAGRGGDGAATFRREAHVPRGGVDGGDGGDGGNIVLEVDPSRRDLAHLRGRTTFTATDGGHGERSNRHGARGADEVIMLPAGTQVTTPDGSRICDLTRPHERFTLARGGQGGRGNTHFVTPRRRAPAFAEIGLPGEEIDIELRLKLMADAALVGLPNAGKSSLLRRISNARPKVAAYPFTTLVPVLGTVNRPDGSQIVVVDVPGLLDGASEGHGLGHEFLPHLERARLLVHMVSVEDGPEVAAAAFGTICEELWAYDPGIARLPRIVLLSKRDLCDDSEVDAVEAAVREASNQLEDRRGEVHAISAVSSATNRGIVDFLNLLFRLTQVDEAEEPTFASGASSVPTLRELDEYRVFRPVPTRRRWRIYRERGAFRVTGDPALRQLAEQAAASDDDAELLLLDWLDSHGVVHALRAAGAQIGTEVEVCGVITRV